MCRECMRVLLLLAFAGVNVCFVQADRYSDDALAPDRYCQSILVLSRRHSGAACDGSMSIHSSVIGIIQML